MIEDVDGSNYDRAQLATFSADQEEAKKMKKATKSNIQDGYVRRARVMRIVDGDTVDLSVDLGFDTWHNARFRLYGINTPETYRVKKSSDEYKAGKAATEFVEQWLMEHGVVEVHETPAGKMNFLTIVIRSHKEGKGKYGRWLCTIHPVSGDGASLNDTLVEEGHAKVAKY